MERAHVPKEYSFQKKQADLMQMFKVVDKFVKVDFTISQ